MKLLARIFDKGRAWVAGTNGAHIFYDCPLDQVFFDALKVSKEAFVTVLRNAHASHLTRNAIALSDLRESVENEPEVTNEMFLERALASDIDNAVVRWQYETLQMSPDVVATINGCADRLPAEAFWTEGRGCAEADHTTSRSRGVPSACCAS